MRVGGATTDVQLQKLLPNTAYSLSLFALYGESASEPLTKQGVTCKFTNPVNPIFITHRQQILILNLNSCLSFSAHATSGGAEGP